MKRQKLQTPRGFRDFLPQKMAIRNEAINRLRNIFEKYGFTELQTPAVEYQEVLLGKYGEEAEKLMYLFKDPGGRDVGLRYDLTIPLARVVSNYPDLPKPFKRYQIQPAWRADKPQQGRYREFFQCDIDIVGSRSPLADAEIIAVTNGSLKALEFNNFKIRINSRNVIFQIMDKTGISKDKQLSVIQSMDKLDKKSKEEVVKELTQKGISLEQTKTLFEQTQKAKPDEFLQEVIDFSYKLGVEKNRLVFDPNLSRGLDYYTGPIYESVVEKPKIGSITGGGRYDKLLNNLGGPDLPATGTTIGLDRVCDVIEELNLWPNLLKSSTKVLVTIFNKELLIQSIKLAKVLRKFGINTELYPDESASLDKQLKYADKKNILWVVIVGPDELKENIVTLKNLKTRTQEKVSLNTLASRIPNQ